MGGTAAVCIVVGRDVSSTLHPEVHGTLPVSSNAAPMLVLCGCVCLNTCVSFLCCAVLC
jgi:hypothetical protein